MSSCGWTGDPRAPVRARRDADEWCARQGLTRQASPLVVDGNAAIEALVDLDRGLRIAATAGSGEELQAVRAAGDGVIVADDPLVLEAEDGLRIESGWPRPIGRSGISGWPREAGIEAWEEGREVGIGPLTVAHGSETEFVTQAILEGAKEPLDATFGLGALGGDPLDAQFLEGAFDLGGRGFPSELFLQGQGTLRRLAVKDPMAIAVRCDGDALSLRERREDLEITVRIFLVPKGSGEDLPRSVILDGEQGETRATPVQPIMVAPIELHEQAFLQHPLATSAVARWPPPPYAGQARLAQDAADRGTREGEAFPLGQEFLQVVVVHARVGGRGEAHDAGADTVRDPVDGRAPAIPMDEGGKAPGANSRAQPADLTNGPSQEFGGLS